MVKVIFDGKTYVEQDVNSITMTTQKCSCGNALYIPLGAWVLGIVSDCSHCNKDYPKEQHCAALTQSYKEILSFEEGGVVEI